jgi:hypothetical protein
MELIVEYICKLTEAAAKETDEKGQGLLFPKKVLGKTKKKIKITAGMVKDLLARLQSKPKF